LVPKQHSSGGKDRLGSISKQGDRYLRSLFVAGALSVIRYAKAHGSKHRPWLTALLARRPAKVAAIARPGPDPRRALWPAVMRTAPTGRTHGRTDQVCDVKKVLANPEPSRHGTERRSVSAELTAGIGGAADLSSVAFRASKSVCDHPAPAAKLWLRSTREVRGEHAAWDGECG
jgi:hypothetical protein